MKISPRQYDDEDKKSLVAKIISELPEDFVIGAGEATAHLSEANGGTIRIYPTPNTKSRITGVNLPGVAEDLKSEWNSIFFKYRGRKFFISYD